MSSYLYASSNSRYPQDLVINIYSFLRVYSLFFNFIDLYASFISIVTLHTDRGLEG